MNHVKNFNKKIYSLNCAHRFSGVHSFNKSLKYDVSGQEASILRSYFVPVNKHLK
jgi:hypothetical protein